MKKIAIVCGNTDRPIRRKAVKVLSRILQDYTLEYPICVTHAGEAPSSYRKIFIGTAAELVVHIEALPAQSESYAITVKNDTVYIVGADDHGVLYGCVDFYTQYILKQEFPNDDRYRVNCFETALPDFSYASGPAVKDRGIWTWGHVIYDYRGFIDHMVLLKMNTLIVWNDHVPYNAREMVDYAHDCGVKVIWGFAWGWDTGDVTPSLEKIFASSQTIFDRYQREYGDVGGDGIYFQSFTETNYEHIGGVLIAEAVTEFVNRTAALFYEAYPDMEIQFGLHATSVKGRLEYIRRTDPRIRIVWENCGAFPFSYVPNDVQDFDQTMEFVKRITVLRGENDRFGAVTKGLTKLDWSKFEHIDGPVYIGAASPWMKRNRMERKSKIWRYIQAQWMIHGGEALEMMRTMAQAKDGNLCITGLIEDGVFGAQLMFPAALFGEMLWDNESTVEALIERTALRSDVTFA